MGEPLQLYSYWRSSAAVPRAHRPQPEGLAYDIVPVHLLRRRPATFGRIPRHQPRSSWSRCSGHGHRRLSQSLAILEYLDEMWPTPSAAAEHHLRRRQRDAALAAG